MPPPPTFSPNNYGYRRQQFTPYDDNGYRYDGRRKIRGYSQSQGPTRGFSGLDQYHALQAGARAFEDPRFPGESAAEIGRDLLSRDEMVQGGRIVPRRMGTHRGASMMSREDKVQTAMRDGSFRAIREKFNRESKTQRMNKRGEIVDVPERREATPRELATMARGVAAGAVGGPVAAAALAAARKGTETEEERSDPNAGIAAMIERMPKERGEPTLRETRQMLKDAEMDRRVSFDSSGNVSRIESKYGVGTAGPKTGPSMVRDDFGRMVPMKDYLERRRFVESTRSKPRVA